MHKINIKEVKRLFIGIPIPEQMQTSIYQDLIHLQEREDNPIRWIPKENYHITLHFIGNTSPDKMEYMITHLAQSLADTHKFTIDFTQYVFFPRRNPYMIWAKAEDNTAFDALQKKIQLLFSTQPHVSKPAIPHVTLARFKNPKTAKRIALPTLGAPFTIGVNSVVLWKSILRPEGASYQEISTIHLQH